MIGVSVSDILKVLDQIPLWKNLAGLPKRLAALEARVTALEAGKAAHQGPSATTCPRDGATMTFVAEKADPTFGDLGVVVHELRCDNCGFKAIRRYDPANGYS